LHEQFDIVVDSGTLEHIFDTRAALMNLGRMLRPGGRAIHMTPCNNFANHGFFQISPTLLIDYYHANAFGEVRAWVAAQTTDDPATSDWELFQMDPDRQPVMMTSRQKLLTLVVAEKKQDSTVEAIPLQSYYRDQFEPSKRGEKQPQIADTWAGRWKQRLPVGLKHFVRTHFLRSAHEKPWGCRRVGKLK
jgi:SAM-dependent methyltransferase